MGIQYDILFIIFILKERELSVYLYRYTKFFYLKKIQKASTFDAFQIS